MQKKKQIIKLYWKVLRFLETLISNQCHKTIIFVIN